MSDKSYDEIQAIIAKTERDYHLTMAKLKQEQINFLGKNACREYRLEKIVWKTTEGSKGPYEIANDEDNKYIDDYYILKKDLQDHGKRMEKDRFFIWLFPDGTAAGRKTQGKNYYMKQ